jgi:plasmid stability protein
MNVQPVTLNLPETLYRKVQQRAEKMRRSVEDELVEVVAAALPESDDLPQEITEVLSQLSFLDDAALWQAARTRVSSDQAEQLEELNLKQQREGLIPEERQMRDQLLRRYEQTMLVRAQAASLLQEHGHDISDLTLFSAPAE